MKCLNNIISKLTGELRHDYIVKQVSKKLKEQGNYSFVNTHIEYYDAKSKCVLGEVDILAYDERFNVLHFYEVKGRFSKSNFKKAKTQFKRFQEYNPNKVIGVYVSPQKVKRLR